MSAPEFTVGERVRLIIDATYMASDAGHHEFKDSTGRTLYLAKDALEGVTVERVAPVGWPPQTGDVWVDRDGEEWHALARFNGEPLMAIDAEAVTQEPADLLARFGPLRLVRRREPVTEDRQWAVRHPGIGVLTYGTEQDAWNAAGTAGTVLYRDSRTESWQEPA